jgi:hypothetical protein
MKFSIFLLFSSVYATSNIVIKPIQNLPSASLNFNELLISIGILVIGCFLLLLWAKHAGARKIFGIEFGNKKSSSNNCEDCDTWPKKYNGLQRIWSILAEIYCIKNYDLIKQQRNKSEEILSTILQSYYMKNFATLMYDILLKEKNDTAVNEHVDYYRYERIASDCIREIRDTLRTCFYANGLSSSHKSDVEFQTYIEDKIKFIIDSADAFFDRMYNGMKVPRVDLIDIERANVDILYKSIKKIFEDARDLANKADIKIKSLLEEIKMTNTSINLNENSFLDNDSLKKIKIIKGNLS